MIFNIIWSFDIFSWNLLRLFLSMVLYFQFCICIYIYIYIYICVYIYIMYNSIYTFFCYITWFVVTRHWRSCKWNFYVKSYCFSETISKLFKNYELLQQSVCLENGEKFLYKSSNLHYDTKLANEVQKYKSMYDKAYKQHLFFLSRKMYF